MLDRIAHASSLNDENSISHTNVPRNIEARPHKHVLCILIALAGATKCLNVPIPMAVTFSQCRTRDSLSKLHRCFRLHQSQLIMLEAVVSSDRPIPMLCSVSREQSISDSTSRWSDSFALWRRIGRGTGLIKQTIASIRNRTRLALNSRLHGLLTLRESKRIRKLWTKLQQSAKYRYQDRRQGAEDRRSFAPATVRTRSSSGEQF